MPSIARVLMTGVALGALQASAAFAQDASRTTQLASAASEPTTGNQLTEIVVTAQKRSQKINDVGMAITAATGRELIEKNVTSVAGLTRIEPSLQFSQSNNGTPVYTIRGVGYFEQSLTATPTVSVYQDEVAYTYPIMTKGALLDVERVEVLKGPQGTLYGQNATGGASNCIAAKPTDHFTAGMDATYARFNAVDLSGFVSGPLTDTLTARLALRLQEGGAWQKSDTRNETLGDKDNKFGRLLLTWRPNDRFSATLNVNGWADDSDTQAGQLEGFHFQSPNFISALTPNSATPVQPYSQYPQGIQNILANPIAPANDRAADWVAGSHPRNHETYYQISLRADYIVSDAFNITSLSNYENYHQRDLRDLAGVNTNNIAGVFHGTVETWSQELRFHGVLDDKRINWMVGGNVDITKTNELDDFNEFLESASYLTGGSPESAIPTAAGFGPFTEFLALNTDHAKTYSVFANVDYNPIASVGLHGGIRYTESDQDIHGCAFVYNEGLNIVVNSISKALGGNGAGATPGQCNTLGPDHNSGLQHNVLDQSNVPWRVGIDWKPIANNLIYFTVSRGYKAGSSPALGAETYQQFTPVTQESLLAYELGIKSTLLENTLQVNGALFHYDYTNKQILGRSPDPIFTTLQELVNIPKSTVDGAELSIDWQPVRGLTLDAAATYLDSKVTSDFINYSSYVTSQADTINLKGEAFPFTPKWSLHYGGRYQWPLNDRLTAFVSADGSYQTKTVGAFGAVHAASEGPPVDIKAYGLLDLAAGVESADRRWRVEVWGKNVTDTYYWTTVFYASDTTVRDAGMPATYGVTLSWRY
jgi:iron complex outermembrane receptor protein